MPKDNFQNDRMKSLDRNIVYDINNVQNQQNNSVVQMQSRVNNTLSPQAQQQYESVIVDKNFKMSENRLINNQNDNFNKIEKHQRQEKRKPIITMVIICVAFLYICFLLCGIFSSNWEEKNGEKSIVIMDLDDLTNLDEYKKLKDLYMRTSEIYKKTIDIDYKLFVNPDNYLEYSMSYSDLLNEISKLITDAKALKINTKYQNLQSQLTLWLTGDTEYPGAISIYIQNVIKALSFNDIEAQQNAQISKTQMIHNFEIINSNFKKLSINTKGTSDIEDYSWNTKEYSGNIFEEDSNIDKEEDKKDEKDSTLDKEKDKKENTTEKETEHNDE